MAVTELDGISIPIKVDLSGLRTQLNLAATQLKDHPIPERIVKVKVVASVSTGAVNQAKKDVAAELNRAVTKAIEVRPTFRVTRANLRELHRDINAGIEKWDLHVNILPQVSEAGRQKIVDQIGTLVIEVQGRWTGYTQGGGPPAGSGPSGPAPNAPVAPVPGPPVGPAPVGAATPTGAGAGAVVVATAAAARGRPARTTPVAQPVAPATPAATPPVVTAPAQPRAGGTGGLSPVLMAAGKKAGADQMPQDDSVGIGRPSRKRRTRLSGRPTGVSAAEEAANPTPRAPRRFIREMNAMFETVEDDKGNVYQRVRENPLEGLQGILSGGLGTLDTKLAKLYDDALKTPGGLAEVRRKLGSPVRPRGAEEAAAWGETYAGLLRAENPKGYSNLLRGRDLRPTSANISFSARFAAMQGLSSFLYGAQARARDEAMGITVKPAEGSTVGIRAQTPQAAIISRLEALGTDWRHWTREGMSLEDIEEQVLRGTKGFARGGEIGQPDWLDLSSKNPYQALSRALNVFPNAIPEFHERALVEGVPGRFRIGGPGYQAQVDQGNRIFSLGMDTFSSLGERYPDVAKRISILGDRVLPVRPEGVVTGEYEDVPLLERPYLGQRLSFSTGNLLRNYGDLPWDTAPWRSTRRERWDPHTGELRGNAGRGPIATAVHEWGHALWNPGGGVRNIGAAPLDDMEVALLNRAADPSLDPVSGYGMTNPGEAWSENYVARMLDPRMTVGGDRWTQGTVAIDKLLKGRGLASGGKAGGPVVVGEQGDELFVPESAGWIIPHHLMDQLPKGGGRGRATGGGIGGPTTGFPGGFHVPSWVYQDPTLVSPLTSYQKFAAMGNTTQAQRFWTVFVKRFQAANTARAQAGAQQAQAQQAWAAGMNQARGAQQAAAGPSPAQGAAGARINIPNIGAAFGYGPAFGAATAAAAAAAGGGGGGGGGGAGPAAPAPPPPPGQNVRLGPNALGQVRRATRAGSDLDAMRMQVIQQGAAISEAQSLTPVRALSVSIGQILSQLTGRAQIQERARIASFRLEESQKATTAFEGAQENLGKLNREMDKFNDVLATGGTLTPKAQIRYAELPDLITDVEDEVAEAREEAVARLKKSAAAEKDILHRGDVTRNVLAGTTGVVLGTVGFSLALGAFQQGMALAAAATEPLIDRLSGFAMTTAKVTNALRDSTKAASGNAQQTVASMAAETGLAEATYARISPSLELRAATEAGNLNLKAQIEMTRASARAQGEQVGGYDRNLFSGTGGPIPFAPQILGTPSTFEQVVNALSMGPDINKAPGHIPTPNEGTFVGSMYDTLFSLMPGEKKAYEERYTKEMGVREEIQGVSAELFNDQLQRAGGQYQFQKVAPGMRGILQQAQATGLAADLKKEHPELTGQADDYIRMVVEKGIVLADTFGNIATTGDDMILTMDQIAKMSKTPSMGVFLAMNQSQRRAQQLGIEARSQMALEMQLPLQRNLQFLGNRPLAPGAGIVPMTGTGVQVPGQGFGGFSATDPLATQAFNRLKQTAGPVFDRIIKSSTEARESMAKIVPASTLNELEDLGIAKAGYQLQIANEQTALSAVEYNHQLYITKRSLADALALAGKRTGAEAGHLGALERENVMIQRQGQLLAFAFQQRQINFNKAVAGFVAPGITGAERAARVDFAKQQANYEQQQLNLQKRSFGTGIKIFDETNKRAIKDLQFAIDDLQAQHQLQINIAEAEANIGFIDSRIAQLTEDANVHIQKVFAEEEAKLNEALARAAQVPVKSAEDFEAILQATGDAWTEFGTQALDWFSIFDTSIDRIRGETGSGRRPGEGGQPGPTHNPQFATGMRGRFSQPTSITVGDAGGEEVAILRNPRSMMIGGSSTGEQGTGGVTVVIQGNSFRDERDAAFFATKVSQEVEKVLNRRAALLGFRRPA